MTFAALLFALIAAHCLCDYPLQGDFLALGKNHKNPLPGVPWQQCLFAHAMIQGSSVFLLTGSLTLALLEVTFHAFIDYGKSEGWYGFHCDQAMHVTLRCVYAAVMFK